MRWVNAQLQRVQGWVERAIQQEVVLSSLCLLIISFYKSKVTLAFDSSVQYCKHS